MAHKLKLVVEDLFQDPTYIRLVDWSVYDSRIPVTNRVIKLEIPGQERFKLVKLPVSGSFPFTSKSLKISSQVEDLPDGLWVATLSVCPNEKIFTHVYHFRTVALEHQLFALMGKVLGNSIKSEVNGILIDCLLKLKALKGNTIDNYNAQKAYDLYAEIEKALNSLAIK